MNDSINRWFDFVEEYYRQSSVPLSWVLIPNPQITSCRLAGTAIGMTTLSKREWNKIIGGNNVLDGTYLGKLHQQEVKTNVRTRRN